MNERIRELKEQAWTLVSIEERDRGELYQAREQWERCDQKFAELIIKECLSIVEPTEDSGDEWCVTLKGAAQEIREHFGVEE